MHTALITGITGQDGSYLAELLLAKGYDVHGLVRRSSVITRTRIEHLRGHERLTLHYGDMTDHSSLLHTLELVRPDEVYNLAAMSHVSVSFEMPEFTRSTNAGGTNNLLRALTEAGRPGVRVYQASSSEIFGTSAVPCVETSPFHPRSPYGESKLEAHLAITRFRDDGAFAVNGIAFNHESPRRGENFVTRKITKAVAAIDAGIQDHLDLGNVDAVRDWGFAPEYVEAMWLTLQQDNPTDYVLATGVPHSVKDFLAAAFDHVGRDWKDHVQFDAGFTRPVEVDVIAGDPSRAASMLGWRARTTALDVAALMVDADREDLRRLLRS